MNKKNTDIKKYNKKELKDYINENGFFYGMEINAIGEAPEKYKKKMPEGAMYFEGIASDGEFSRNGYKIKKDAWKPAVKGYMANPVILLQHDSDEAIGNALWAEVTEKGLEIGGYLFDDYTNSRFSRGLLKGISTGHLTQEVEFENTATGEILNEEEFMRLKWEEQMKDEWILVVNALEWIETSIVTLPSNRKALITAKNAIMNYIDKHKVTKNEIEGEPQTEEEENEGVPEEEAPKQEDQTVSEETETPEATENEGENPEAGDKPSENEEELPSDATVPEALEIEKNSLEIETNNFDPAKVDSSAILDKIKADPALNYFFEKLLGTFEAQKNEIVKLEGQLKNTPSKKGLANINNNKQSSNGYQKGDLVKSLFAKHKI